MNINKEIFGIIRFTLLVKRIEERKFYCRIKDHSDCAGSLSCEMNHDSIYADRFHTFQFHFSENASSGKCYA